MSKIYKAEDVVFITKAVTGSFKVAVKGVPMNVIGKQLNAGLQDVIIKCENIENGGTEETFTLSKLLDLDEDGDVQFFNLVLADRGYYE